jgi:hypothetical protein
MFGLLLLVAFAVRRLAGVGSSAAEPQVRDAA